MKRVILIILFTQTTLFADFLNLDFESYSGSGNDLLPNWERSADDYIWPLLDAYPISTAGLGLVTKDGTYGPAIDGEYSLFLCSGHRPLPNTSEICLVSIWQTAMVPPDKTHLQFAANDLYGCDFTLGVIDLLSSSPALLPNGYYQYSTDIRSLAGQTATLTLSAFADGCAWNRIDDIQFVSVPEPSSIIFMAMGAVMFFLRKKFPTNKM